MKVKALCSSLNYCIANEPKMYGYSSQIWYIEATGRWKIEGGRYTFRSWRGRTTEGEEIRHFRQVPKIPRSFFRHSYLFLHKTGRGWEVKIVLRSRKTSQSRLTYHRFMIFSETGEPILAARPPESTSTTPAAGATTTTNAQNNNNHRGLAIWPATRTNGRE